jgi:N-acetylmuramoyl-L-alanine amidase
MIPNMIQRASPNFNDRALPIAMLVLHYTGMKSGAEAIDWLANPASSVSAHYVVAEDGTVLQMVAEARRAWHAGRSWWRGITDVNSASIGIEIVNPGHEYGYVPFPTEQMDAVAALVADIVARHGIKPANVVGHSDIAPTRKQDPGELFDWPRLAASGLAAQPLPSPDPKWTDAGFLMALGRYGYDVGAPLETVLAFQRRHRPARLDGLIDAECRSILRGLLLAEGL